MSIVGLLNPQLKDDERKIRLAQLAESMSKIALVYGLTPDELSDALKAAVEKKRLRGVQSQVDGMAKNGVRK